MNGQSLQVPEVSEHFAKPGYYAINSWFSRMIFIDTIFRFQTTKKAKH
jgi:hypothetical protein